MKKILSCNTSIASAVLLRDTIGEITGKHFVISKEAGDIGEEGCLLRYGNGFPINPNYQDTEYNHPDFIELCADKKKSSDTLQNLDVVTPVFYTKIDRFIPMGFPVIVRETLKGSGGEGISLVKSEEEFRNKWKPGLFWTPYINVKYEVRIYVVDGKITHAYYKVPFANQADNNTPVRSDFHYSYTNPDGKFKKLRNVIRKIIDSTSGKFFSLDAGWIPELDEYVVFELNSGSWMNKSIVKPLAEYLVNKLQLNI